MTAVRIVDDEPVIAEMIGVLLSLESIPHAVTSDHFDDLLSAEPWQDITSALVDLNLGIGITGQDILRYLKENQPHIRRVVLSAVSDVDEVREEVGHLAHCVLAKPAGIHQILDEVRRG